MKRIEKKSKKAIAQQYHASQYFVMSRFDCAQIPWVQNANSPVTFCAGLFFA
ncbi:hypothetical protein [Undibacterium flavidum]|uniref:Uncharacterized protein n=1 Tax=Undibacterium flavidum TaxID=2762297 RepID=A0ABR6YD59_9BURK|nr:hypothetical protein [Undibacterium flavidum]MBC3874493.1 hypothetical protein [Undibacterium flavidum]